MTLLAVLVSCAAASLWGYGKRGVAQRSCVRPCKSTKDLCVAEFCFPLPAADGFFALRTQDLVPYMVRRQFLPPAAVEAAAQGGSPHDMRAGPGPVAVSPERGDPEAPPDGGEGGASRGSTAPSEDNGRSEGERLVAAACERYLGSGSGLGFEDLGGAGEHGGRGGGGGARACGVYLAGAACFCARATSVQAYADINRCRPPCFVSSSVNTMACIPCPRWGKGKRSLS